MALPSDFSKIFGSTATGGITPPSDVNYAKGWEWVGSNPPEKNDFNYLQNLSDLKSQWLYLNKLQRTDPFGDIKSDGAAAIAAAQSNLNLSDIVLAGVTGGLLAANGHIDVPVIIGGVKRTVILQWGAAACAATPQTVTPFPYPFPTDCLAVISSGLQVNYQYQAYVTLNNFSRTQFAWGAFYSAASTVPAPPTAAGQVSCRYIAIGY